MRDCALSTVGRYARATFGTKKCAREYHAKRSPNGDKVLFK